MRGAIGFILIFGIMYYYMPDLTTQLFKSVGHLLATLISTILSEVQHALGGNR